MIVGPIFHRELAITPRRTGIYVYRATYAAAVMILISTAWLVLAGTQVIRNVGDMARFGTMLFQIVAPLQLALVVFFAALSTASSISQEKDRRTLILLLMTRMTNSELVLGKLLASLLPLLVMIAAGTPIFLLGVLFGGVSFAQVARVFAVTFLTAITAGSLGAMLAFWREKTFQTLALTALVLCFWLGWWQFVATGGLGPAWLGISCESWATGFSPLLAIVSASRPFLIEDAGLGMIRNPVIFFLINNLAIAIIICTVSMMRVRVWNPSREVRGARHEEDLITESTDVTRTPSIWGVQFDLAQERAERAREGHVDARLRSESGKGAKSRLVWDNPILWRELMTWAYGRKIILIRLAYLVLVASAFVALHAALSETATIGGAGVSLLPAVAKPMAPLFLVSLVLVNALAVTSITTERDGQSLDLLLATDLSPAEFVFGKLGGVLSVAGLMVVLPLVMAWYLWWRGGMNLENMIFTTISLLVMNGFVAVLGIHCGMRYANSRTAIGVSLGTVFFLFLGVVACMLMMISFSNSFEVQMAPFLAFIVGGGIGLYVSLGVGNPSKAIAASSIIAPFATFYAITSFLMEKNLSVFLVTVATYGFTTAAMLIPALAEFDFAMGRSSPNDES